MCSCIHDQNREPYHPVRAKAKSALYILQTMMPLFSFQFSRLHLWPSVVRVHHVSRPTPAVQSAKRPAFMTALKRGLRPTQQCSRNVVATLRMVSRAAARSYANQHCAAGIERKPGLVSCSLSRRSLVFASGRGKGSR